MRTAQRHEPSDFVMCYWEELAALAWMQYRQGGRGFSILREEDLARTAAAGEILSEFIFAANRPRMKRCPDKQLVSVVEQYDPRREIIVVVLHGSGCTVIHGAPDDAPSPPQCARKLRRRVGRWTERKPTRSGLA